jgi:transcriptional regulator with GAF, ATPase, and Fis domain
MGALDEGLDSREQPHPGEEETSGETCGSQNVSFGPEAAFGGILGQSGAWRHLIRQIEVIAPTEATVLVSGETGTGKELSARELHRWCGRVLGNKAHHAALSHGEAGLETAAGNRRE